MEDVLLNEHNKEEFPPAHTAEHLLNQVMVRMFGCERSCNAHVERKKSKISWIVDHKPDRKEEQTIERQMNELIEADLPVTYEFVTRAELEGTPVRRFDWCVLETMMSARVLANMYAQRLR